MVVTIPKRETLCFCINFAARSTDIIQFEFTILFVSECLLSRARKKDFTFKFKLPTSFDFHGLLDGEARAELVNAAN